MGERVLNADGSVTETNDDGSKTTTWDDGKALVDYPDGSSMTTFADGRVLNVYVDGTRTLNDQFGTPLDPDTGQPLGGGGDQPIPEEASIDQILAGGYSLKTLAEAYGLIAHSAAAEATAGGLEIVLVTFEVFHALEAQFRSHGTMGRCYGLMTGALDLERPVFVRGPYGLADDEDQAEKERRFYEGVEGAAQELADGELGTGLRNRILLRTAYLKDPRLVLNEMWVSLCEASGDHVYAEKLSLSWPDVAMR